MRSIVWYVLRPILFTNGRVYYLFMDYAKLTTRRILTHTKSTA